MVASIPSSNGNGQFKPGNKSGRGGGIKAHKGAAFRAAIFRAITPADVAKLVKLIKAAAFKGDLAAAKLLLQYTAGDPALVVQLQQSVELTVSVSEYTQAVLLDPAAVAAHKRLSETLIGGRPCLPP